MSWNHSGQKADKAAKKGERLELDGMPYLVHSGYYVPYYEPLHQDAARMQERRERLNIELCNRVFRISDARDVSRRDVKAEEAIEVLKKLYADTKAGERRGVGRVLFGRIVSRIRDLSRHYIEHETEADLEKIRALYSFVMVDNPELFQCVRLYDHSIDRDGIIEEAFSEIGKPQQQALEDIYASRAAKIGAAMASMHEVSAAMLAVIDANPMLPLMEVKETLKDYTAKTARITGFPASDHKAYDPAAAEYVDAFDALQGAIQRIDQLNVARGRSHKLAEWLCDGLNLIDSMQNIRDVRHESVARFKERADEWL